MLTYCQAPDRDGVAEEMSVAFHAHERSKLFDQGNSLLSIICKLKVIWLARICFFNWSNSERNLQLIIVLSEPRLRSLRIGN